MVSNKNKMTPLYKDVIFQSECSTRNYVKLLRFSNFISTFFYIVATVVYDLLFFLSVSYLICEGLYLYKFDRKPSNSVHNFVKSIMSEYAKIHRDKFMYIPQSTREGKQSGVAFGIGQIVIILI